MAIRKPNSTKDGGSWTDQTKLAVWRKGGEIPGYDSGRWRWDNYGSTMDYNQYGNRNSTTGWEIDHINPVSKGGGDEIGNLQPLQWENNAGKADNLNWKKTV